MATHGKPQNVVKSRTGTSPTVPRQTRNVPATGAAADSKTNSKLTSSSTVSRTTKPAAQVLSRGKSFDNKSSPSNAPLQKSHSTAGRSTTKTASVSKPLLKSQKSDAVGRSAGNIRPGSLNRKVAANTNVVANRKVKSGDAVKAPMNDQTLSDSETPVNAEEEKNHGSDINEEETNEGSIMNVDSDHDHDYDEQQRVSKDGEEEEEESVVDEESIINHHQMDEEKEEHQIVIEEQSEIKTETNIDHDDPPMDADQEQVNDRHLPLMGDEEQIKEKEIETNEVPPMGQVAEEEDQIKIDDPDLDHDHEEQAQDPIHNTDETQTEININPEEPKQEPEQVKEEQPPPPPPQQPQEEGEKFLKASEIRKLMEAQSSGKDLTSTATPRLLVRGSSGLSRGSFNKRESTPESASPSAYNEVIEETASKLIAEKRRNKVLALAGAFETVISLQQD